jgi:hypothetical protein
MGSGSEFYNPSMSAQSTANNQPKLNFVYPHPHHVTLYLQINDQNKTIEDLRNHLQNHQPTSEDPLAVGENNSEWISDSLDIGTFLMGTDYGRGTDSGYQQEKSVVIRQYKDITTVDKDTGPATCRVTLHERASDLIQKDGSSYSWPPAWERNKMVEGTCFKIDVSHVDSPDQGIDRAVDLLKQTDLPLDPTKIRKKLISDTYRFSVLELYHRFNINKEALVEKALENTQQLFGAENNPDGVTEKDHYVSKNIKLNDISKAGFDQTVATPGGLSDELNGIHLKIYKYTAESYGRKNSLRHPKIEIEAEGAYPAPLFEDVRHRLAEVLNAHVGDWAGLTLDHLVADDYYQGSDQPSTATYSPTEYREKMIEHAGSDIQHHKIDTYLHNGYSDVPKDILFVLSQSQNPKYDRLTYDQIANRTGATKGTIGDWAGQMENDNICHKIPGQQYRVSLQKGVVDYLRDQFAPGHPIGDIAREVRLRKAQREFKRWRKEFKRNRNVESPIQLNTICYRNPPTAISTVSHRKLNGQYRPDDFLAVVCPPP